MDILRHEAGHLVVAKLLGFQTGKLHFRQTDAGAEVTLAPLVSNLEELVAYLERRIAMLYAGAFSEALEGRTVNRERAHEFLGSAVAMNDHAKIRELLRVLAAVTQGEEGFEASLGKQELHLSEKAVSLVEKYAIEIDKVSKDLHRCYNENGGDSLELSAVQVDQLDSVKSLAMGSECSL